MGVSILRLTTVRRRKNDAGVLVDGSESHSAVTAIRPLMLTGCRLSEILTLRWAYVDLAAGELNLLDTKTGGRAVLAFVVPAIAADNGALKAESVGVVEVKPGQPIEVQALLSDTVVPSVSPLVQAAIEMAIKDFGPINGHQVSVETLDEMCSGEGGRATAEAVVADAQVVGIIGTLCSGAAVEASPVVSKAGLSMISPSNTSPVLTSDLAGNAGPHYHKGYYRITDNDLIEASIVAKFSCQELGLRTMVTIHDGDDSRWRRIHERHLERFCHCIPSAWGRGSGRR